MKQHQRGKDLFQFRNHSMFQSEKQELKHFRKNVSVFQAKLVLVPAFRLRMLGCFDLSAQLNRRRCEKTKSF